MSFIKLFQFICKSSKYPFLLVFLFSSSFLYADVLNLESVLSKMEEQEKIIKDVQFTFKQVAEITVTKEAQQIRGKAFFKKPDKFRIEYFSPRKQVIVSNGQTLWIYTPTYNQVIKDTWKSWTKNVGFPKELINFHAHVKELEKRFFLELVIPEKSPDNRFILIMKPRKDSTMVYTVRLLIDSEDYLPRRTELYSKSFITKTEISDLQINTVIKDSFFQFKIPRGVEVYQGSKMLE